MTPRAIRRAAERKANKLDRKAATRTVSFTAPQPRTSGTRLENNSLEEADRARTPLKHKSKPTAPIPSSPPIPEPSKARAKSC